MSSGVPATVHCRPMSIRSEEIVTLLLTQLIPSRTFDFRAQLQAIVYVALMDAA